MEHLSSAMEQQNQEQQHIQWRRDKVQELCSKGLSQREISQVLRFDKPIICRK
jgi:Trp operon repressor